MTAPPPETRYEQTPEYLFVYARGVFTTAWFKGFVEEVVTSAETSVPPPRAILVDVGDITGGHLSDMDRYEIGVLAARHYIGVPVALVGPERLVDPRRLGELVARNRGLNVRVFTDMDEAKAWLRNPI